jgi:hypothetical protein
MELNCIVDGIRLVGTAIKKLNIENNIADIGYNGKNNFGFNINEPEFKTGSDYVMANMLIDFEIEISYGEQSCKIQMTMEGAFVSNGTIDLDSFKNMVIINGAAALIGIARGKIEAISGNIFNNGKITIPFVNVFDYYKSMSNE